MDTPSKIIYCHQCAAYFAYSGFGDELDAEDVAGFAQFMGWEPATDSAGQAACFFCPVCIQARELPLAAEADDKSGRWARMTLP